MTPLKGLADALASRGRYGDTELLHVNRHELDMLEAMSPHGLTVNPDTGQKEAFLPFLIPLLSSALAPTLGASLFGGGMLGTGLASAIMSGLGTWAATGDAKQGLLGGALGGLGGALMGGAGSAASGAANAASGAANSVGQSAIGSILEKGAKSLTQDIPQLVAPKIATANPAAAGGLMGWVRDNPMKTALGGAALASMIGGQGGGATAPTPTPFVYRPATPSPRAIIPYVGDMDEYGQNNGEHQFFDPPSGTEPLLVGGRQPYEFNVGGHPYSVQPGGIADGYAAGGAIAGPGNGQSDHVPAVGPGGRPYQLSDGEYVIPADVVSALGAGSNKAGATELSDMLQRVRLQAFGTKEQMKPVNPGQAMPA